MSQGRHGIKVLGLSLLAALGLMAFAASAQAAEFLIEEGGVKKTFTTHGLASETFTGAVGEGSLLVPALPLTITCTGGTFSGTALLGGIVHATILFSGCQATAVCKPYETHAKMLTNLAADRGFILASALGGLTVMNGKHYLLATSLNFTTIYWPPACALTLENVVAGSGVIELPNALTPAVTQQAKVLKQAELETLIEPKPGEKVFLWSDRLTYGSQTAWLDEITGPGTAALSGPLKGKLWGAH